MQSVPGLLASIVDMMCDSETKRLLHANNECNAAGTYLQEGELAKYLDSFASSGTLSIC